MAVQLQESVLPLLLPWLEQHLPVSFKLCQDLKSHLGGRFPHLQFFVDRWPHPRAVVARVDPTSKLECKTFFENVIVGVLSVKDDALVSVLRDGQLVDWSQRVVFCFVEESLWPVLLSLIRERCETVRLYPLIMLKAKPQDVKHLPVPTGLKIVPIRDSLCEVVSSTWKFSCAGSEGFIRDLSRRLPSVMMLTEAGEHVGHMLRQTHGEMGMLYVQPAFRGRGYAKVLVSYLAKTFQDGEDDPYVLVEESNLPGIALHLAVGFQQVPGVRVSWLRATPKDTATHLED